MRRISNLMSQGEFKLNVAAGMTFSSVRDHVLVCARSRRGHHCKARLDRPNDGSRSAGEGLCVLQSFLFHDTTRLNGRLFLIYFVSLFHLTP